MIALGERLCLDGGRVGRDAVVGLAVDALPALSKGGLACCVDCLGSVRFATVELINNTRRSPCDVREHFPCKCLRALVLANGIETVLVDTSQNFTPPPDRLPEPVENLTGRTAGEGGVGDGSRQASDSCEVEAGPDGVLLAMLVLVGHLDNSGGHPATVDADTRLVSE